MREIGDTTLVDNEAGEGMDGFNGAGSEQSLSGDGTLLAFATDAANISAEDADGGGQDVFVKHLTTGAVTLVSRAAGAGGAAGDAFSAIGEISGDGTTRGVRVRGVEPRARHDLTQQVLRARPRRPRPPRTISRSPAGAPAVSASGGDDALADLGRR